MGIFDFLKKPKYDYTPQEVEEKIRNATKLREPKTPLEEALEETHSPESENSDATQLIQTRGKKSAQSRILENESNEKNHFLVTESFKLHPLFILKGRVVTGQIHRGMVAHFKNEAIQVRGIQEGLQHAPRLSKNCLGSLEIQSNIGLHIPDGTVMEFKWKKDAKTKKSAKRKKRKSSKRKKTNTPNAQAPKTNPPGIESGTLPPEPAQTAQPPEFP